MITFLTIPLSSSSPTNLTNWDNCNEILWMDRYKEQYTTCSVCTFVPNLTPDQIGVIVQVYNLFALPAMPISWSGRWGETRRDTETLVGLPKKTQILQNVVHPLHRQDMINEYVMLGWQESLRKVQWLYKLLQMYRQESLSTCEIFLQICPVRTLPACWRSTRRKRPRRCSERLGEILAR